MAPNAPLSFPGTSTVVDRVAFSKAELSAILRLYGQMVARGEWRDYSMTFGRDAAIFSIFRRTAEMPLYQIEKRPAARNRQGGFTLVAEGGRILHRGHEIEIVLKALRRRLIRPID